MNTNSKFGQRPIAAIILAAGEAKRFGAAKQVLVWKGKTLVELAVNSCLEADCTHLVIVTGAHQEEVQLSLKPISSSPNISLAQNHDWAEGMHTSIARGMKTLLQHDLKIDAVLIVLVDQPLVDAAFLRKLIAAQKGNDAAALGYPSGPGVPACFGESLFPRLRNLTNAGGGAKAILRDPSVKTILVNDPDKRRDIDTFDDWNDFNRTQQ